jgi:gluconokinase
MVIVVMGVSGSGKTTIGSLLAQQLRWSFADADEYHSAANVEKMRKGIPLTDKDREPWLEALRGLIIGWVGTSCDAVLACSSLKQTYRQRLRINEQAKLVYLKGSGALLSQRLLDRKGHYMKEQMLESQLAILEEPEDAIVVDVSGTPEQMVSEIRRALELS